MFESLANSVLPWSKLSVKPPSEALSKETSMRRFAHDAKHPKPLARDRPDYQ